MTNKCVIYVRIAVPPRDQQPLATQITEYRRDASKSRCRLIKLIKARRAVCERAIRGT